MKYRKILAPSLVMLVAYFLLDFLYVGKEVYYREHSIDEITFIKQKPTFTSSYINPILCGECDVKELYSLDEKELDYFKEFCAVRYGLNIKECYAIYALGQKDEAIHLIENAINKVKYNKSATFEYNRPSFEATK